MPVLTSTASGSGLQRAELSPSVSGSGHPPAEPRATVDRPRSVDSEPHTFRGVLRWAVQALDVLGALLRRMLEQARDLRELLCRVLDDRDVWARGKPSSSSTSVTSKIGPLAPPSKTTAPVPAGDGMFRSRAGTLFPLRPPGMPPMFPAARAAASADDAESEAAGEP